MKRDFLEERAGEAVFPSCAEEQSQAPVGKRCELPGADPGHRPVLPLNTDVYPSACVDLGDSEGSGAQGR